MLYRFPHHGSPALQRFPTVFTRNFRVSSRLWLPRATVNISTKPAPETTRFRDELVRSASPKSFSDHVRYPGIRNQILVSRIEGPVSELVCTERAACPVFHLRLFRCVLHSCQTHELRHKFLGPKAFTRVKHLDYGSARVRPDEEGEVL